MDEATARWLTSDAAAEALALARAEPDPTSVAAATRLRRRFAPEQAAAALAQAALRRKAVAKFGEAAARLFFTADGLEQATRGVVASWRAQRLAAAGVTAIADLGCGLGTDALALAAAGLDVVAVEADPATAVLARANLGPGVRVVIGDAEQLWPQLAGPGPAVFADPARRTGRGRSWQVADLSPSWEFVRGLLDGSRVAAVKLGPGFPLPLIPDGVSATWVSADGDLVELCLWAGAGGAPREALLLPGGHTLAATAARDVPLAPIGGWLLEPDPAVIRSGAVPALAELLDARAPAPGVAYLTTDRPARTPFATTFEVLAELDASTKALRAWVRREGVGVLEIKKRGLDVDPAALRRALRPAGPAAATLVLTPTPRGARALVVRRVR